MLYLNISHFYHIPAKSIFPAPYSKVRRKRKAMYRVQISCPKLAEKPQIHFKFGFSISINPIYLQIYPLTLISWFISAVYHLTAPKTWASNPKPPCLEDQCVCSVAQSSLTLCNPRDGSLPGSSVHGIFPARILYWLSFPSPCIFQSRDWTPISCVSCIATASPWLFSTEPWGKPKEIGAGVQMLFVQPNPREAYKPQALSFPHPLSLDTPICACDEKSSQKQECLVEVLTLRSDRPGSKPYLFHLPSTWTWASSLPLFVLVPSYFPLSWLSQAIQIKHLTWCLVYRKSWKDVSSYN